MKTNIHKVRSKANSYKKPLLIAGLVGLLVLGVLFLLEKKQVINLYTNHKSPSVADDTDAATTSTAPSAQEDFTGGTPREIAVSDKKEGTVEDSRGNVTTVPESSTWSSSADGKITVYTPSKNGLITSGSTVSGTSKLSSVSFRLIDDTSGVIAQGTLSVVNGKFSGNFNFSNSATSGRLDIFTAAADGVESSNVEIPIRFR